MLKLLGEANKNYILQWNGKIQRKHSNLPASLSAFRCHPAINHLMRGRREGRLSDPWDLGSEIPGLPGRKLHATEWQLLEATQLPIHGFGDVS
jgi:hypothetical protein